MEFCKIVGAFFPSSTIPSEAEQPEQKYIY
jgi:hypothetical protein